MASEKRRFKMDPALLLSVIKRQAGTLDKAIMEGAMNAVEAGATRLDITLTTTRCTIKDDGGGITDEESIAKFFETFGTPHDPKEKKVYAQFRMGRGQMFSFGRNAWRTGPFSMLVDVAKDGLDYTLVREKKQAVGCEIVIDLYEPILPSQVHEHERTLARWFVWAPIPIYVNGENVVKDPAKAEWTTVTDDAYVKLAAASGPLSVYNLGFHVNDIGAHQYGASGVVVSRKQLLVNFARNDIQSTCPVWRRVKTLLSDRTLEMTKRAPRLTDWQRTRMCERFRYGEIPYSDVEDVKLITDVSGRGMTICDFLDRVSLHAFKVAADDGVTRAGDRVHQSKLAFVLDSRTLGCFKYEAAAGQAFLDWLGEAAGRRNHRGEFVPLAEATAGLSDKFDLIPIDKASPAVASWMMLLASVYSSAHYSGLQRLLTGYSDDDWRRPRRILLGRADTALAWTDGSTYIAFDEKYLADAPFTLEGIARLTLTLCHELAHDSVDTASHSHTPEFYEAYHEITRVLQPRLVSEGVKRLPDVLRSLGRKATKQQAKLADAEARSGQIKAALAKA